MNKKSLIDIKNKLEVLPKEAKMYFLGFAEGCALMRPENKEETETEKDSENKVKDEEHERSA